MKQPLVSVICLCYNHNRFVEEALASVINQSYENLQIIVVDDGSKDGSKMTIENLIADKPEIQYVDLKQNLGNTKAFNRGFELAKGQYIIDLACDDVLLKDRIKKQVMFFGLLTQDYGVIYSDAQYINELGNPKGLHFDSKIFKPYTGLVFKELVGEYFIPPPTMMMRRDVLEELKGYDENLAYEDFDFWVRSSRNWKYGFQDEVLTKIRKVKGSHSDTLYSKGDSKLQSTIVICKKIEHLIHDDQERAALVKRLKYELKHAVLTGNRHEAESLFEMLHRHNGQNLLDKLLIQINKIGIDASALRNLLMRAKR